MMVGYKWDQELLAFIIYIFTFDINKKNENKILLSSMTQF